MNGQSVWNESFGYDPKHISSVVKQSGGSVMAWPCMAASEAHSIIFTDATHDERIQKSIEKICLPIYREMYSV